MRKSEKLKKIQLLLNQKNLYEDQYERLLAATGDWKSNYTDYLITEPIAERKLDAGFLRE